MLLGKSLDFSKVISEKALFENRHFVWKLGGARFFRGQESISYCRSH